MDAMAWYFVSLTAVGMLGLVGFEEKGHRLVTFFYLLFVLLLGLAGSLSVMHWFGV
jgi:hypothetical protein